MNVGIDYRHEIYLNQVSRTFIDSIDVKTDKTLLNDIDKIIHKIMINLRL